MLELYFGGNKDSLIKEATKLIYLPEPSFKPITQPSELNPEAIDDMGFEQVYKSETRYFTVRDNSRIFAYKFPNRSESTIVLIHGVASSAYMYNKTRSWKEIKDNVYGKKGTPRRKELEILQKNRYI